MSLFNGNSGRGKPGANPFEQAVVERDHLAHLLSQERKAHTKTKAERDELAQQKEQHARDFPNCMKPKPSGPTCPQCGIFYVVGPHPCQGCGYAAG